DGVTSQELGVDRLRCRNGLLAWNQLDTKNVKLSKAAFRRWNAALVDLNKWVVDSARPQFVEWEEQDGIYCLRLYATLERRSKKWQFSDALDEEGRLYDILISSHHMKMPWVMRRTLLVAIVKSRPRAWHEDLAFSNLITSLDEIADYSAFILALTNAAKQAQVDSLNEFLGPVESKRSYDDKQDDAAAPEHKKTKTEKSDNKSSDSTKYSDSKKNGYKKDGRWAYFKNKWHWVPKKKYNENSDSSNKKDSKSDSKPQSESNGKTSSTTSKPTSSSYSQDSVALSFDMGDISLFVREGYVTSSFDRTRTTKCVIGFDTLAGVNCVTQEFADLAGLETISLDKTTYLKGVGDKPLTIEQHAFAVLKYAGYSVKLDFWVIPQLPRGIDVIISYGDIPKFGITITEQSHSEPNQGGFQASLEQQLSAALAELESETVNENNGWKALPGAKNYRGRVRPITSKEVHDTKNQQFVFEIPWSNPPDQTQSKPSLSRDYS
ncbi:hypothetical protein FOL47_003094, partial [Perkinsus chesapeaki]